MIRILLVDDHKVMRDGLRLLLEDQPDMTVVGEADHGRQALDQIARLELDVVVMDVAMPELNGIEATRQIRARSPEIGIVALSMYNEQRVVTEMLSAGASAFVVKGSGTEELVEAIRLEVPLKRLAKVGEIVPTAVLLASEDGGAYYHGAVLNISGGHVT